MFFHHKKSLWLPRICLYHEDTILYQGLLKDLPIKEHVLIEKSIHFFNDPEPCNIHRTAVRIRLTEELQKNLPLLSNESGCNMLNEICDLAEINRYTLV